MRSRLGVAGEQQREPVDARRGRVVEGSERVLVALGAAAAVTRVLVTAMIRDLFEGEEMARVMSLVFMVFMVVPMLAPNIGQAILWLADWRAIFLVLAGILRRQTNRHPAALASLTDEHPELFARHVACQ